MLRQFRSMAMVVVICLSGLSLPTPGQLTKPSAQPIRENHSLSKGQSPGKEQQDDVANEHQTGFGPVVRIDDGQFKQLMENLKSGTPRIGPFPVDLTTILNALLWITAIIVTWRIASTQTKHNKKQFAINLHAQYFEVNHYLHVIAPVVEIRMKWWFLKDSAQTLYRKEVTEGWPPYHRFTEDPSGLDRYLGGVSADEDFSRMHFRDQKKRKSLTEHQALSAFLHFWSHLSTFISKRVADRDTCIELFADTYRYHLDFIRELRDSVVDNWRKHAGDGGNRDRPRWIRNTELLEQQLFGKGATAHPTATKADENSSGLLKPVASQKEIWLILLAILLFCVAVSSCVVYFAKDRVWSHPGPWGEFGEYVGGILGPALAIINIMVIASIAYHLHHLEAAREESTRRAEHAMALRTVTLSQWDLWNSGEMLHSRITADCLLKKNHKTIKELEDEQDFEHVSRVLHFFDSLGYLKDQKMIDEEVAKRLFRYYFDHFKKYFTVLFGAQGADIGDWKPMAARVRALALWLADDPSTGTLPEPTVSNDMTTSN